MQTGHDSATNAVSEEPPTPKNVVVARRGAAAGIVAAALYLLLTLYAGMAGWQGREHVAFARTTLTLMMLAGLGIALFGYGVHRSERKQAAVADEQEERTFQREQWELKQFDALHAADEKLAGVVLAGARELHAVRVDQAALVGELRELRVLIAQHDLRSGRRRRRPKARPARRSPRVVRDGEELAQPASLEVRRAARRLLDKVTGAESRGRWEDNREDKS